jgi:hypothetical protein
VPLQEDNSRNIVPYIRTIVHKESLFPSTIRLWNPLPEATAAVLDLESFKKEIQAVRCIVVTLLVVL